MLGSLRKVEGDGGLQADAGRTIGDCQGALTRFSERTHASATENPMNAAPRVVSNAKGAAGIVG